MPLLVPLSFISASNTVESVNTFPYASVSSDPEKYFPVPNQK